ncbi:MAG: hypothetical protein IPO90_00040 [Flavobacteriales bacterium]|nr:hypothetical protein [Flavobacteriales bacterium]
MNEELSTTSGGLRKRLDEAEVLLTVVQQLRKDLNEEEIPVPEVGEHAFEQIRSVVLQHMEEWQRKDPAAFSRAINRVDLSERQVDHAMLRGGLRELAGDMVLRCLLKVLLRKRFAGLG